MIPFYGCQAAGGKVYSLDDPAVVKDGAALDGTGGTAFVPFLVTTPFGIRVDLGYSRLRRFLQRVTHAGACTFVVTGIRDGQESGISVTRALAVGAIGVLNFPLAETGSDFQLKLALTSFTGETALGDAQVFIVPKRGSR